MRYVGSKYKLSKDLAPIIQSYITNDTTGYLEPFVGGANWDKVYEIIQDVFKDCNVELWRLDKG